MIDTEKTFGFIGILVLAGLIAAIWHFESFVEFWFVGVIFIQIMANLIFSSFHKRFLRESDDQEGLADITNLRQSPWSFGIAVLIMGTVSGVVLFLIKRLLIHLGSYIL